MIKFSILEDIRMINIFILILTLLTATIAILMYNLYKAAIKRDVDSLRYEVIKDTIYVDILAAGLLREDYLRGDKRENSLTVRLFGKMHDIITNFNHYTAMGGKRDNEIDLHVAMAAHSYDRIVNWDLLADNKRFMRLQDRYVETGISAIPRDWTKNMT